MVPLTPDTVRTDLEVLRGPVALSHEKEVAGGVVGGLVRDRKRVLAVVATLGLALLGTLGGGWYTVRDYYVAQGVEKEKSRAALQAAEELRKRVLILEWTCVRRDLPIPTSPDRPLLTPGVP